MKTILFIYFLIALPISDASEQDTFQAYLTEVEDSSVEINDIINEKIVLALNQANLKKGCSVGRLEDYLKYQLANANLIGINDIQNEIDFSPKVKKFKKDFKESVFKDLSWRESLACNTYGLGPLVKINNIIIGTDKIGHFLTEGYTYYEKATFRKWNVNKALEFGHATEAGFYGIMMTGILSNADLSANFNGLRFWRNALQKYPAVIEEDKEIKPIFKCVNNYWEIDAPFSIEKYVDHSWDESINCNIYATDLIASKIENKLIDLEKKHNTKLRCPRDVSLCQGLVPKYGIYSDKIMHRQCQ